MKCVYDDDHTIVGEAFHPSLEVHVDFYLRQGDILDSECD
jgi:hypothetical protein